MTDKFKPFAEAVRKRFAEMAEWGTLFTVGVDRDQIWQMYLAAFPPGSDPVFRKRTEHDCSCCRHFIRSIGNVVAIENGALSSVWDLNGLPSPYQEVADVMAEYIKAQAISGVFVTPFSKHGTARSHEHGKNGVLTWNHFSVDVPAGFVRPNCDQVRGKAMTTADLLLRGLTELKADALSTVLDLIDDKAIYRHDEFRWPVATFKQLQERFLGLGSVDEKHLFIWSNISNPVARFKNTAIGTLVEDISSGMKIEAAVRSYETKVAPQNYKRPTALITKRMVEDAMKTIRELGLETALERRHARLTDVSVNSVLFVDGSVRGKMKDGIETLLMEEVKPQPFDPDRTEEIDIDRFVSSVLPRTQKIDLYLDSSLGSNFMSMTAPVHEDAAPLFRWPNNFAWSYEGNVTDSIKAKVKRAGGQVEGVAMRVSLAWYNTDDLDLHVLEPDGNHIAYFNKSGKLDVDMNVSRTVRDPVENIRWIRNLKDGRYIVMVHNFRRRESVDVGFTVEIESGGVLRTIRFDHALSDRQQINVAVITIEGGWIEKVDLGNRMVLGSSSQDMWGLKTLDLVKVNSVVLSPNHWDGLSVGNKHWFFLLDKCINPNPCRGIYNEFLKPGLEKHRKVFEVLGDKTKCPVVPDQLSGVGFSSTRGDKVSVVAMGPSLRKAYTIVF